MYAFSMKMVVFSDCFIVYASPKCVHFQMTIALVRMVPPNFFPGYIKRQMDPVSYW